MNEKQMNDEHRILNEEGSSKFDIHQSLFKFMPDLVFVSHNYPGAVSFRAGVLTNSPAFIPNRPRR